MKKYLDKYGRTWNGPHPFTKESISSFAVNKHGVYQVLYVAGNDLVPAYIGIATSKTIKQRLDSHVSGKGNWALGRLCENSNFVFIYYECNAEIAHYIEGHVISDAKPPFNVRPEWKYYIPSIMIN